MSELEVVNPEYILSEKCYISMGSSAVLKLWVFEM
jgi:hypothetical protein